MKKINLLPVFLVAAVFLIFTACTKIEPKKVNDIEPELPLDSIVAIAKDAYIYAFPMVDLYRIEYAYFVDSLSPEYKTSWNTIKNIPKVYTPEDKAVQTPNSDTPYSWAGLDLRAEPIVLTIPKIEENRYYSVQLVNAYTNNFDYIGSRTTGNNGGVYMVAGPNWKGEKPQGIDKVYTSETELAMAVYRTQLFDPSDIDNVIKIQNQYKMQTLSSFLNEEAPKNIPAIDFIKPLTPAEEKESIEVFNILNFVFQFCPVMPTEVGVRERFAKIGIGAGKTFDVATLSPEVKAAFEEGIKQAWTVDFAEVLKKVKEGKVTSASLFGTSQFIDGNYLYRMTASVLGILGNTAQEAIYPMYQIDAEGQPLDGANKYTLYFAKGDLPPVHSFWSLTMYELPQSLLVANPINRYLLNSPMLPSFVYDKDGGLTFYIQNESPGKDKEANWLPAPKGQFRAVLRLYWPKESAIDGTWKNPPMELVK